MTTASTDEQTVSQIARLIQRSGSPRDLGVYYRVGAIIDRVKERGYGRNYFEWLARQLMSREISGMGEETLYKCHRLFRRVSPTEIQHLCKLGVSFRIASNLGTKNLTDAGRQSLMRDLKKGAYGRKQLNRRKLAEEFRRALGSRGIARSPRWLAATDNALTRALDRLQTILRQPPNADAHQEAIDLAREHLRHLEKLVRS